MSVFQLRPTSLVSGSIAGSGTSGWVANPGASAATSWTLIDDSTVPPATPATGDELVFFAAGVATLVYGLPDQAIPAGEYVSKVELFTYTEAQNLSGGSSAPTIVMSVPNLGSLGTDIRSYSAFGWESVVHTYNVGDIDQALVNAMTLSMAANGGGGTPGLDNHRVRSAFVELTTTQQNNDLSVTIDMAAFSGPGEMAEDHFSTAFSLVV